MTRRMLINAANPGEVRIAVLAGTALESYQVEVAERNLLRGNIYRGVIANIQPALNAAFVDFGAERHGFLAIQDVVEEAYYHPASGRPRIEDVLERGKPIVVQVEKDPEGSKGAALTTNLSIAGRYLVLTPFDPVRGVSRKVEDEEDRKRLKETAAGLKVPDGCGVIVRTNAMEQNKTALQRDLQALLRVWKSVEGEARKGRGTKLLYSDQDLVLRALRDWLDTSIAEVLVDDPEAYNRAAEYMRAFMPRTKTRLTLYEDRTPIFSAFDLEPQVDRIYERTVPLPSGGSLVIDKTEALTAIDVNSGRATRAASQEETAVHTNMEAAREVARQLRLRDIGGLVVVDFIDMRAQKSQRKVEKELREAMKADKARSTVGKISPNGLLEINRQRIQQALLLRTHRPCPTCGGMGRISSPEMVGLALIRRIQERAATNTLKSVRIALHPELSDALQNGRRRELADLEEEFDIRIEVVASRSLRRTEQKVEWFDREPGEERKPKPKPVIALAPPPPLPDLDDEEELEDEEAEAESDAEVAADDGGGKKRKRRRRGRRRGRGSEAAASAAPAAQTAAPATAAAQPAKAERREPRDGGRGRRQPEPFDGTLGHEGGSEPADADFAEELPVAATDGAVAVESGAPKAKRRRRRGGRGRRRRGEAGANGAPNGEHAGEDEGANGEAGEHDVDAAGEAHEEVFDHAPAAPPPPAPAPAPAHAAEPEAPPAASASAGSSWFQRPTRESAGALAPAEAATGGEASGSRDDGEPAAGADGVPTPWAPTE